MIVINEDIVLDARFPIKFIILELFSCRARQLVSCLPLLCNCHEKKNDDNFRFKSSRSPVPDYEWRRADKDLHNDIESMFRMIYAAMCRYK